MPGYTMSVSPEMVDTERFISNGLDESVSRAPSLPILLCSSQPQTFFSDVLCLLLFSLSFPYQISGLSELRVVSLAALFLHAGMKIANVYQGPGTVLSTLHMLTHPVILTITL